MLLLLLLLLEVEILFYTRFPTSSSSCLLSSRFFLYKYIYILKSKQNRKTRTSCFLGDPVQQVIRSALYKSAFLCGCNQKSWLFTSFSIRVKQTSFVFI